MGQQFLIERAPIGTDADGLVVPDGHFDDGGELAVALVLEADIAGIDAVFGERFGASRVIGEQGVTDIVEIANERHSDAALHEFIADMGDGGGGFIAVNRDADELGACANEGSDLLHRAINVSGVGIRHGLHDNRRAATDDHTADTNGDGLMALCGSGTDRGGETGFSSHQAAFVWSRQ